MSGYLCGYNDLWVWLTGKRVYKRLSSDLTFGNAMYLYIY